MAVRNLFSFTSLKGYEYDVKYDDVAQAVFTDTSAPEDKIEQSVTAPEMGANQGQTFYHECIGTTLLKVIGRQIYPFAFITRIVESPSCGFIPGPSGGCTFTKNVSVIGETFVGEKDGIATLNITLPAQQPVLFSLNNLNWQRSNVFSNLAPGTYNWYAKSFTGVCKTNGQFVIAAGAVRQEIVYPWKDRHCHLFQLTRNEVTVKIAEPIKWDAVNIKGKRDADFHGWKDQYSDEIIELEFDCPAGRDILQAEYDVNGSDGVVRFQYGITYKVTDYIFFDGKINFNTFKSYPEKVTASVESALYNSRIETFLETKIALNAETTLDGLVAIPPTVISFPLHGKAIANSFVVNTSAPFDLPATELSEAAKSFILPDTSTATSNDIEDSFIRPLENSTDAPYDGGAFNFKVKFGGTYTFNIHYSLNLKYRLNTSTGTMAVGNYFMINDIKTLVSVATSYPMAAGNFVNTPVDYSYVATVILSAGDEVYFFTQLDITLIRRPVHDPTKYQLDITQTSTSITIQSLEAAANSKCRGWLLFDAINHVLNCITNGENYLKSSFLGLKNAQQAADGGGSLFVTTNGKQIRNFDSISIPIIGQHALPITHPLIISLKDLRDSAKALFCLGFGFEDVAGTQVVRMERVDYFYQNKELLVIDEIQDKTYRTEAAKELLYNEYLIGYDKYQQDGSNTLDEFNTYQEGTTPIQTNKLKLNQKSLLIASGYSIESSRRQQFADTPTDSYQNDEDGFIIALRRFTPTSDSFVPEKTEPFSSVTGIISPDTAYNIRISPARMLRNWAIWLRNAFHYKADTAKIKPSFVAQNGELRSQFLPTEARPVGDINKNSIKEKMDFDLNAYPVEERLYRPEWIYFTASLTPDKIQLINKCMKGAGPAEKNYGYIAVKDDQGLYQAGFIYELDYNFSTEQATIKMLKKFGNPVTPGEECCKYLLVNGCRVLVNGQKLIL